MNKINSIFLAFDAFVAIALPAHAQDPAQSLDARVNEAFANFTGPFVSFIFAPIPGTDFPWIVMWLVVGATVFTIYFAAVQFRFFGQDRKSTRLNSSH